MVGCVAAESVMADVHGEWARSGVLCKTHHQQDVVRTDDGLEDERSTGGCGVHPDQTFGNVVFVQMGAEIHPEEPGKKQDL